MLDQEIKQIIEKSLPSQVGKVLSERLETADKDANKVIHLNKLTKELRDEINGLKDMAKVHRDLVNRETLLRAGLAKLTEDKNNLAVTLLTTRLEESEKRADMVMDFTNQLMRNTIARKKILDSENQVPYDTNTGMIYPTTVSKSLEETKEDK